MNTGRFEDAAPSSPMPGEGSTSPLVALIACGVMLLLMFVA
jgi:formiminotetrahydrofolate cyclodeaminase